MTFDPFNLSALPDPLALRAADGPLDVDVRLPGSKSITNRALICAALAGGTSLLNGALAADDVAAMVEILGHIGATVEVDGDQLRVEGCSGSPTPSSVPLDVRQSGTTARFITPLLALGSGTYTVTAHPQMQLRPMGETFGALTDLGASVEPLGDPGYLPVRLGAGLRHGGSLTVSGAVSSQFLSGLLLSGPCTKTGLTIKVERELVSRPYVDMTISVMESFGATVEQPDANTFVVEPTGYRAATFEIEPDASAASYPLAAAAVCGGRVKVLGLTDNAIQGDAAFADALAQMGAVLHRDPEGTEVNVERGSLVGGHFDMTNISDTAQTLACVAPFVTSPVSITGIGFIRNKEIDRLSAVTKELTRCGVEVQQHQDGWNIKPGHVGPAVVQTYDDHRMAMSFALLGLATGHVSIAGPTCVAKTFPDFWGRLDQWAPGVVTQLHQ